MLHSTSVAPLQLRPSSPRQWVRLAEPPALHQPAAAVMLVPPAHTPPLGQGRQSAKLLPRVRLYSPSGHWVNTPALQKPPAGHLIWATMCFPASREANSVLGLGHLVALGAETLQWPS